MKSHEKRMSDQKETLNTANQIHRIGAEGCFYVPQGTFKIMNSILNDKLSVRRKRNRTIRSYDKYDPSSLAMLPVLLYGMGTIIVEMLAFRSVDELLTAFLILAIPTYGLYVIAEHSFNATNISMDSNRFVIYDTPIPIRFRQVVERKDIQAISAKTDSTSSSKLSSGYYSVSLVLSDSKEITILEKIAKKMHAKAIQKILEEELKTSREFDPESF
ncbi:hypothetical protein [Leptospira stimsonii]|uniref:DUF304 domain-containing protein n=1 Tax=Leptospira stimsonii TaxID=2202203 RepID=A0ABY2N007_9LEPT|nr:hypothetical protein [Leptospira stimsonii]TGK17785.1 hypothetical protein EHO98_13700 [Leptospira stimsonii]TGM12627.1 hypothetical protein EHQ90_15140 [Leptospira stimsonii]